MSIASVICFFYSFFFNDTATTEIYTLSLHDALPISPVRESRSPGGSRRAASCRPDARRRSEEHTSELQSRFELVCRLLLEKKKQEIAKNLQVSILFDHMNFSCSRLADVSHTI